MRSWWGWGDGARAVGADELDGLASLVAGGLGMEPAAPIEPPAPEAVDLPRSRVTPPAALAQLASTTAPDRLRHGHGQSFREVAEAVRGRVATPPDLVLRPRDPAEVSAVLNWCSDAGIACVPYGGGTSVVGGVTPLPDRPTVSVDLERLTGLRDLDVRSGHARFGAGTLGPAVEHALRPHGLTLRHFPQSWEFSTVGGWIATRAGGHYATGWTRIDEFVAAIAAEAPAGRWESCRLPGSGAGPSPDRLLLGSEGTLAVITDAWLRVQPRPVFRATATVYFDDFSSGAAGVRALARSSLRPANCRLLDPVEALLSGAAAAQHSGAAVLMLGFESADHCQRAIMERGLELSADHGGRCPDGPRFIEGDGVDRGDDAGGAAAWRSTFLRAPYLRDGLVRLGMIVETFETAVTWDRFDDLVEAVREAATSATAQLCGGGAVATRITHAYPDGAAPYFTVIAPGGDAPVGRWDAIKAAVSESILTGGGTITHHHAVGRDHRPWYERQRPRLFAAALGAVKQTLDPAGVLNAGVLLPTLRSHDADDSP